MELAIVANSARLITHGDSALHADTASQELEPMPRQRANILKSQAHLNNIQIFTSYVTEYTPSRLMLFRETVDVYWENHTEYTNTPCGQNAELFNIKVGDTYDYHCA
jgi:hypothetical protein